MTSGKVSNDNLQSSIFEWVPFADGQWEEVPCDNCGNPVIFPLPVRPGHIVAKCSECGMEYADATDRENDFLNGIEYDRK